MPVAARRGAHAAPDTIGAAGSTRPPRLEIDVLPVETSRVLFDLTRLVRNRRRPFATGIDRIDLAAARALLGRFGDRCRFVHAGPAGPLLLDTAFGVALIERLTRIWEGEPSLQQGSGGKPGSPRGAVAARLAAATLNGLVVGPASDLSDTTYVNVSHSGLLAEGGVGRLDPAGRMHRLAYLHDLIPLDFPEYQSPVALRRFRRFLDALVMPPVAAPLVLAANSADTAAAIAVRADAEGWPVGRIEVVRPRLVPVIGRPPADSRPPGPAAAACLADPRPYFVMVGTIEPRKNHLLVLKLWRRFISEGRDLRLLVIGRRGWENEMVLDMLERCTALHGAVCELGDLPDSDVWMLLRGARALLMPSFAEGFGIPVLEAAASGTPAIVSDLPALREIAAPGTVFLDPLDGPGWARAILDAAR